MLENVFSVIDSSAKNLSNMFCIFSLSRSCSALRCAAVFGWDARFSAEQNLYKASMLKAAFA